MSVDGLPDWDEFVAESWRRGDLDYKRHEGQRQLTQASRRTSNLLTVLHAARGYGKSFNALLDCCEIGLDKSKRDQRLLFVAPTRDEARKIVESVMPMVIEDAPEDLKPRELSSKNRYIFPGTRTTLLIEGADHKKGNHLRGPHVHYAVCDEAGFYGHCNNVIYSVLMPMAERVGGRILVQSTSPESVGHEFVGVCEDAKRRETYHKFTIHQNPRLSVERIQGLAEDLSGMQGPPSWQSTVVRRELLCEFVTELSRAVVPEFNEELHVEPFTEMPAFCDTFVGIDLGLIDFTHALFGFWDFHKAKFYIQDEVVGQYLRTKDFSEMAKAKEKELWGHLPYFGAGAYGAYNRAPWARFSDNAATQLHDLQSFGYECAPAIKTDADAMLNAVRTAIQSGKIVIHPRCKVLIHQLKVGVWNERRTDYVRIPSAGHLDGIDALKYLWKMADFKRNPIPRDLSDFTQYHIPEHLRKQQSHALQGLVIRRR